MTTFVIIKTSTIDIMDVNDQKGIFGAGGPPVVGHGRSCGKSFKIKIAKSEMKDLLD